MIRTVPTDRPQRPRRGHRHGDSTVAQTVRGVSGETGSSAQADGRIAHAGPHDRAGAARPGADLGVDGGGARLPASAGATAPAAVHTGGTAATAVARPGPAPGAGATVRTRGVALGPAVKYVREPDGTVRQVR